jgi:hypothetical protein
MTCVTAEQVRAVRHAAQCLSTARATRLSAVCARLEHRLGAQPITSSRNRTTAKKENCGKVKYNDEVAKYFGDYHGR